MQQGSSNLDAYCRIAGFPSSLLESRSGGVTAHGHRHLIHAYWLDFKCLTLLNLHKLKERADPTFISMRNQILIYECETIVDVKKSD